MGRVSIDCPHCEELREELAYLRSELGLQLEAAELDDLKRRFGLSPGTARLLALLYGANRRPMTRHQIEDAIPARDEDLERSYGYVSTLVCQLRDRIGRGSVLNVFGTGYRLSDEMHQVVAAVVEPVRQIHQAAR